MKSTGILRRIDELGRVVIPKELRRVRKIEEGTPLEIFVENEKIILKKYDSGKKCIITDDVSEKNIQIGDVILSERGAAEVYQELVHFFKNNKI